MPSPSPDVPPYPVATPYLDTKTLSGRALVTSQDGWDHSAIYEADAVEAQKRGLTIESCRVALGLSSSAFIALSETILCERALASSKDRWDLSSAYEPYAKAAQSRGMTGASCRQALGIQEDKQPTTRWYSNIDSTNLCRAALNFSDSDWGSNYPDAVGEAISRNLTVDGCRGLLRLPALASATQVTPTAEFSLTNNTDQQIGIVFFDGARNRITPGVLSEMLYSRATRTFSVQCSPGENVCYGASKGNMPLGPFWGMGISGGMPELLLDVPRKTGRVLYIQ